MFTYLFFFILSTSNFFFFWLMFTLISMKMLKMIKNFEMKMKYFLVQEFAILLFFFLVYNEMNYLLFLPMMMKMGVTPFFSWLMEIFWKSQKKETIFLISIIKIFPAIMMLFVIFKPHLYFLLGFYGLTSMVLFSFMKSPKNTIFFSSILNFYLGFLMISMTMILMTIFFFFFYIFSIYFSFSLSTQKITETNNSFVLFILGIPPSPIFFFKFILFLFFIWSNFFILLFFFFNILFYYFYFLVTKENFETMNKTFQTQKMMFKENILMFFFLFFIFLF